MEIGGTCKRGGKKWEWNNNRIKKDKNYLSIDRRNVKRREYVTKEIQSKGVEREESNSKKTNGLR